MDSGPSEGIVVAVGRNDPSASAGLERRIHQRIALTVPLTAHAGRVAGIVTNLSRGGARLRHATALKAGPARFAFPWSGEHFVADAAVLQSSMVNSPGGVAYESRLKFGHMTPASGDLLRRVLTTLNDTQMREWMENLHGRMPHAPLDVTPAKHTGFIRCFLEAGAWRKELTREEKQPRDGFLVPNTVPEGDVARMCRAYESMDKDGRELLRLFALAVVA